MKGAAPIRGRLRRQAGQVLPLMAVSIVVLIGMAAIVFDLGRFFVAREQLQNAVNAAALVAGQDLPDATNAFNDAGSYSGAGASNAVGGYGVTANSPVVTFECLSHAPNYTSGSCPDDTSAANCHPAGAQAPQPSGATTCNAVKVTESATVKTTLAGVLPGVSSSYTITATTTAGARGGAVHALNVYVILDTSQSMSSGCSGTVPGITSPDRLDCAKAGVRALLQALWPCDSRLTTCGTATANPPGTLGANVAAPVDKVGMLVFPAMTPNPPTTTTLNKEVDCNSASTFTVNYPTWTPYTYPAAIPAGDRQLGYQAVGLSSDFRPSVGNTTLNWKTASPLSQLVASVDWGQCTGSVYPGPGDNYGLKVIGGQGSYLAGAITEAQYLLGLNARVGATNAIIILSDGQLNDPSGFTDTTPCTSAINAATQAKAAGTLIYSIAYGATGTSCPDPSPNRHTDLQTMQSIASNSQTFYNQPAAGDLTAAFQQVATDLTDSHLIPDCSLPLPAC